MVPVFFFLTFLLGTSIITTTTTTTAAATASTFVRTKNFFPVLGWYHQNITTTTTAFGLFVRGGGGDSQLLSTSNNNNNKMDVGDEETNNHSNENFQSEMTSSSSSSSKELEGNPRPRIGGGAINEKERFYGKTKSTSTKTTKTTTTFHQQSKHTNNHNNTENDQTLSSSSSSSSMYDPFSLSHTLHTLVGLDRYPNYLYRWSDYDIEQIELSLSIRLEQIRKQRNEIFQRRLDIEKLVQKVIETNPEEKEDFQLMMMSSPKTWKDVMTSWIFDSKAINVLLKSSTFTNTTNNNRKKNACSNKRPSLEDVLKGLIHVELDPGQLELWMDEEMFDVYSMPLLSKKFCRVLKKFVRAISALGETKEFSHLNIGHRAMDLDNIGLGWLNDLLFHLVMRPTSRLLFNVTENITDLDWRQGYVAGYSVHPSTSKAATRERLVSHTDDSEVTLNICIGDSDNDFEGGSLCFSGLRGTAEEGKVHGEYKPRVGTALLHVGRHLHEVRDVLSGDRYSLIVWARSWKSIRASTCPCCWLNRRDNVRCICGPQWN